MAEDPTTTSSMDAPAAAPAAEPTESHEKSDTAPHSNDAVAAKSDEEAAADNGDVGDTTVDGENAQGAEDASAEAAADATPMSGSKDKKRKSIGGVPEHKVKKLNKKKSMLTLHLECKPGDYYWARLKGYPPWPAVICDEEMLPETLLGSRPVSTARPDGSIRDDFKEGGKNAKERTFPIMFLSTNEFQWMVNTNLTPLDPEDCKTTPSSKMTKALQHAYQIAAEGHPIEYYKNILKQWQDEEAAIRAEQEAAAAEDERLAAERAAKAEANPGEAGAEKKPKKKAARKSKAADEDADMEDAEAPKSAKKRKKDVDSDPDAPKKKTPKVTKLNAPKTPNGEASATKKSASKPKKKVVTAPKVEAGDESKPQLTEEEKIQQREKAVLYLRHRLQKGFLSRDQAPQESEMAGMADFFAQLEAYEDLEPQIIRTTKIHKVLKAIIKLASVPKDDVYDFKKRSSAMLEVWNKRMEADGEAPPSAVDAPTKAPETNGVASATEETSKAKLDNETAEAPSTEVATSKEEEQDDEKTEEKVESKPDVLSEPAEAPVESTADLGNDAKDEADGDVSMSNAPEATTA